MANFDTPELTRVSTNALYQAISAATTLGCTELLENMLAAPLQHAILSALLSARCARSTTCIALLLAQHCYQCATLIAISAYCQRESVSTLLSPQCAASNLRGV